MLSALLIMHGTGNLILGITLEGITELLVREWMDLRAVYALGPVTRG